MSTISFEGSGAARKYYTSPTDELWKLEVSGYDKWYALAFDKTTDAGRILKKHLLDYTGRIDVTYQTGASLPDVGGLALEELLKTDNVRLVTKVTLDGITAVIENKRVIIQ